MKATTMAATLALCVAVLAEPSFAADPVRGKMLYDNTTTTGAPLSCSNVACHGPDPSTNTKNIRKGADPNVILNAITNNIGGMGFFSPYIKTVEAADIAAYIANPAAGTPKPVASLSSATLAFGNQVVMTSSSAMTATLSNSGTANLVLSSVTLSGTNPGDFTRTGSCTAPLTLAPTQSCTVDVTFRPSALGLRSAAVTIGHNASPTTSAVALTGNGVTAPAPAAGLSATTLAFGDQVIGTPSVAKAVAISNTGTATLTLGTITTTGTNPGDFASTNCTGTSLAPGASCSISVTFTPSALGARSATLSVPSNAAGSPHGVALTGNGTSVPAPSVSLTPTSVAFGNQTTGTTSTARTIALNNTGNASLTIASITASPATGFAVSNNCPASLGAGLGCTISVTFTPASAAAYSSAVTVTTSAAGSPHSVAVTGSGVAPTPTAPVATLSPLALDFGTLPLNTSSATRNVTLSNTGNAPLAISDLKIAGTNTGDFSQTNTCPVGSSLAAGSTCTIGVRFAPTASGARTATVSLTSNAAGAPTVQLAGTGVVQSGAMVQVMPTQVAFGRTRIGKTSDERTIRMRNSGSTPLVISSVAASGDFSQETDCIKTLAPGKSCEVKVRFKPAAAGIRNGSLTIGSNAAGSPHVVKLSGLGVTGSARDDDCDDEAECSQALMPFFRKR